jgi:hypothetical protein
MDTVDAIASVEHVTVQERVVGDVRWIALRARGADWSWLTPKEAAELACEWKERYGAVASDG